VRYAAALALALALAGTGGVHAQDPSGDHTAHHPQGALPAAPPAASPPAAGMMGGGMMEHMAGPPRPFLSNLLALPETTPETRRVMAVEADHWIGWGAQAIAAAQIRLEEALGRGDHLGAQAAAEALREGLAHVQGGVSTLQAVAAGTTPRDFALAWFRREMSLTSTAMHGAGFGGLSWYHVLAMAGLLALAAGLLALQATRLRRAAALVSEAAMAAPPPAAPLPVAQPPPVEPRGPAAAPARAGIWRGRLRVAGVFTETADVKTFRLMPPEGGPVPFCFAPGQFLTVSVEEDGRRLSRSYTIASPPTRSAYVELTVKREANGAVSRHLHDQVRPGDELDLVGPAGAFTFAGDGAEDGVVLIAGGVGITPMMSIVRALTDRCWPGDIHLIYGARSTRDFLFRDELEHLQLRHANLQVVATMRRAEGTAWMGPEGVVTKELIEHSVPDIARRRVHLCGPPPMMAAVRAALAELGVPAEAVRTEAFGPARGQEAPPPTPAPAAAAGVQAPSVSFSRSGKSAPLPAGRTVLEAAEAVGVAIDFSCRVGTCGTCVIPLRSGSVTMAVEDGLPPEDKARGLILACQAKSSADLVVEA